MYDLQYSMMWIAFLRVFFCSMFNVKILLIRIMPKMELSVCCHPLSRIRQCQNENEQTRFSCTFSVCLRLLMVYCGNVWEITPKYHTTVIQSEHVIVIQFLSFCSVALCRLVHSSVGSVHSRLSCHSFGFRENRLCYSDRVHRLLIMSTIFAYHQWACMRATWTYKEWHSTEARSCNRIQWRKSKKAHGKKTPKRIFPQVFFIDTAIFYLFFPGIWIYYQSMIGYSNLECMQSPIVSFRIARFLSFHFFQQSYENIQMMHEKKSGTNLELPESFCLGFNFILQVYRWSNSNANYIE